MSVLTLHLLTIGKLGVGWDSHFRSQTEKSIGFVQQAAAAASLHDISSCCNFNYYTEIVCLIIYKTYFYTKLQRQKLFYFSVYFFELLTLFMKPYLFFRGNP